MQRQSAEMAMGRPLKRQRLTYDDRAEPFGERRVRSTENQLAEESRDESTESESCKDRYQQKGRTSHLCCALEPLIHQLTTGGGARQDLRACVDGRQDLFGRIEEALQKSHDENRHYISDKSRQQLHGMILLRLGFVTSSLTEAVLKTDEALRSTIPLLRCLRALYLYPVGAPGDRSTSCGENTELLGVKASFRAVLQALQGHVDRMFEHLVMIGERPAGSVDHEERNRICAQRCEIMSAGVEIILLLMYDGKLQDSFGDIKADDEDKLLIEQLIGVLVVCYESLSGQDHLTEKVLKLLRILQGSTFDESSNLKAKLAVAAIASKSSDSEVIIIDNAGLTRPLFTKPVDRFTYWRYQCHCTDGVTSSVVIPMDDIVIHELISDDATPEHLVCASECLSQFAQKCHSSQDLSLVIDAIMSIMANPKHQTSPKTLKNVHLGLAAILCRNNDQDMGRVLLSGHLLDAFDFLMKSATNSKTTDDTMRILSARIVCTIISEIVSRGFLEVEDDRCLMLLSAILALLSSRHTTILRVAMGALASWASDPSLLSFALVTHPSFLSKLLIRAHKEGMPADLRCQSLKIAATSLRSGEQCKDQLTILARDPKVLDTLVRAASSSPPRVQSVSGDGADTRVADSSRTLALCVLLRLSSSVCNRRILATHVGVLSVLIHHARSFTATGVIPNGFDSTEEVERKLIDMKSLKSHILRLATAL